jgi:hypothetical protein
MSSIIVLWQDADGRPIAGPRLKLIRAHEHLTSLHTLIADWREANVDAAVVDMNPETGEQVYRRRLVQPLPASVVLTLGDMLQCLRAALDHSMYVIAQSSGVDSDKIEFPIFLHELDSPKDGGGRGGKGFRSGTGSYLGRLPREVQEFLTAQQPYNREKGLDPLRHPLWGLHELVNIDKHRTIPVMISEVRANGLEYLTPTIPDKAPPPDVRWHGPAVNEGDPIVSVPRTDETYMGIPTTYRVLCSPAHERPS